MVRTLLLPVVLIFILAPCPPLLANEGVVDQATARLCERELELADRYLADEPMRALEHARKAVDLAAKAGNDRLELEGARRVAQVELKIGLHMEFLTTTLEALDLASAIGDARLIALQLRDLATAYRSNRRMDQSIAEAKRSLTLIMSLDDDVALTDAHLFMMSTYLMAGSHAEALEMGTEALAHCMDHDDPIGAARVHQITAQTLIAMGKFADALPFLAKAERVLMTQGDPKDRFTLAVDRCRTLLGLGSTVHARDAFDQALALYPGNEDPERRNTMLQLRYEIALAMQEWKSALVHLQELKAHSDSLENARMHMRMAGLQVLHEVKNKEKANALLRTQNARQAETIAGQRSNNRYLIALLCGILVLVVALFITSRYALRMMRRLRRKNEVIRRKNEEIKTQMIELKRQNVRLAESLMSEEEKEMILKEIHHRVKNNLQVVESLLNIQEGDLQDASVKRSMQEARGRIRSMAMVHEHIYRGANQHGSLRKHFEQLGRSVLVAHGVHDRISITVESALPTFPEETLLPLSLVVNELLTNSIKHAFKNVDAGNIMLRIAHDGDRYQLRYSDDGAGFDRAPDNEEKRTFGHELIGILAQQLNGEVEVLRNAGTTFSLTFTPDRELLKAAS